ncbi:MAG: hypothetical protein INR73_19710 [Williamsia sp.]|nr:hypothetical protein [Williamsia sp.]
MSKSYHILVTIGAYSIALAALIGVFRFQQISNKYRPFVYVVWLALFNEALSTYLIYRIRNSAMNSNIYVLFEFFLVLWLFNNLGLFRQKKAYLIFCLFLMPVVWLLDIVILHPFTRFSSIYRIVYSFTLLLFSIDYINYVFFSEKENMLRNPGFLICLGFLIYFSSKGLFEFFYIFRIKRFKNFYLILLYTMGTVNLLANLIYAYAMLWIRKKEIYTSPY